MGLNKLLNQTLFIDTAPLIYFIEGHSQYHKLILENFEANDKGDINFQTSILTLLEVLVQPMKLNQLKLADQYEKILMNSSHIDIYDIDVGISRQAAKLRAEYNLKTPDAIQMGTALQKNADFFFTNDIDLKRVSEIEVLTLKEI